MVIKHKFSLKSSTFGWVYSIFKTKNIQRSMHWSLCSCKSAMSATAFLLFYMLSYWTKTKEQLCITSAQLYSILKPFSLLKAAKAAAKIRRILLQCLSLHWLAHNFLYKVVGLGLMYYYTTYIVCSNYSRKGQ